MTPTQLRRLHRQLNRLNPRRLVAAGVRLFQWADLCMERAFASRTVRSAAEESRAQVRGLGVMAVFFTVAIALHLYAHSHVQINLFSSLNR